MIKRPGRQIPDFSSVELKPLKAELDEKLAQLADKIKQHYDLNQLLLVHRIGWVEAHDTVLLVIVSGTTRDRCFEACSFLVDEIKKEYLIQLMEHK